jgi:hypothetical protein
MINANHFAAKQFSFRRIYPTTTAPKSGEKMNVRGFSGLIVY